MTKKLWRAAKKTLFWWWATDGETDTREYLELYKRVLRYIRPYIFPQLALAVCAMLLNGSVNGMIPLLIKRIINTIAAIPSAKVSAVAIHSMHCWRLKYYLSSLPARSPIFFQTT
jgi:hypothetical protein